MNEEKVTLVVSNRLKNNIKSSSLFKIKHCSLLIYYKGTILNHTPDILAIAHQSDPRLIK